MKTSLSQLSLLCSFVAKVNGVHDVFELGFYASLLAKAALPKGTLSKYALGSAIADCAGALRGHALISLSAQRDRCCLRGAAPPCAHAAQPSCRAHRVCVLRLSHTPHTIHNLLTSNALRLFFSTTTIWVDESAFNDGKVRPTLRLFMLLGLLDDAVKNGNKKSLSERLQRKRSW